MQQLLPVPCGAPRLFLLFIAILLPTAAAEASPSSHTISLLAKAETLMNDGHGGARSADIYRKICYNESGQVVDNSLRISACDLQWEVPRSPPAPTVLGVASAALLSGQIDLQIEQIRELDKETLALSLRQTLAQDAASIWLSQDGSISDDANYTSAEMDETAELRGAYSSLISGLNTNISAAVAKIADALSGAQQELEKRKRDLEKDAAKQKTVSQVAEFAHGLLFAAQMASGISMSGWSTSEEISKMRAEDAAKAAMKEAKDNAGVFKTWLALLKGEHSQAGAHSSDDAAVASIQSLVNKCQTQISVFESISALMLSIQAIANATVPIPADASSTLSPGAQSDESALNFPLLEQLNQSLSATEIQSTADSLIGTLGATATGKSIAVRSNIDAFVGLVQARASAVQGWWSANSRLRVLAATTRMLRSQHDYMAKVCTEATNDAARAAAAVQLLKIHRRARVAAVSASLNRLLWTVNYESGHGRSMDPFAAEVNVSQGDSMGVSPVPSTAALSARHANYLSLLAKGFDGGNSKDALQDGPVRVLDARTANSNALNSRELFYLSCWHAYNFSEADIDLLALKRGEPVIFRIPVPSSQAKLMAKVSGVRAYTLFGDALSETALSSVQNKKSVSDNVAPPQYITISHLGQSHIVTDAQDSAPGRMAYSTFAHARIDFPFGYHIHNLCPIADGPGSGRFWAAGGRVSAQHVSPSLYGAWAAQVSTVDPQNAVAVSQNKEISGIRVEFHTSSWTAQPIDSSSPPCSVPLQLERLISYNEDEPEDPHKAAGIILIVLTSLAVATLFGLSVEYKRRRVEHTRWRANTDIRHIEVELQNHERKLYQAAAAARRASQAHQTQTLNSEQHGDEQNRMERESSQLSHRVSNPFRNFTRRPTPQPETPPRPTWQIQHMTDDNVANASACGAVTEGADVGGADTGGAEKKEESDTVPLGGQRKRVVGRGKKKRGKFPFFGLVTVFAMVIDFAPCKITIVRASVNQLRQFAPFQCPTHCVSPLTGEGSNFAQKQVLLSLSASARGRELQGDNIGAAQTYVCLSNLVQECLPVTDAADATSNAEQLSQSFRTAAHNTGALAHSPTTQSKDMDGSLYLPSRVSFDVLEKLVRKRLECVEDVDADLRALATMQAIDDSILVGEGNRQLMVAVAELKRDEERKSEAQRQSAILRKEIKVLTGKYAEYMQYLSLNIKSALSVETDEISKLTAAIQKSESDKRKKSIWSGLIAGLETVGGAICCAVGLPEAGIPLIIDGVDNAVTSAQTALGPTPAGEDEQKELRQTAQDTISNIKILRSEAVQMSTLVQSITGEQWENTTLAKELPKLALLEVDRSIFSSYMDAFVQQLTVTAGGPAAGALRRSVRELSGTVTMLVQTLKAFLNSHMDLQHAKLQQHLHTMRVAQLQESLAQSMTASNARLHTRNMLAAKRDKYAMDALRSIAMQRRRFTYYSLEDPTLAAKDMPNVWVKPPSATVMDTSASPMDTSALLSSAVSNYIHILRSQAATPTFQAPQSCLVSFAVNSTSHPTAMQKLLRNGSLSLFLMPPLVTTTNVSSFAYDAAVTELHVLVDLEPKERKEESFVRRVRISKSGTDVRLDDSSAVRQYPSETIAFEYLYDVDSECPLSSSQSALSADQSTLLSSSGTSPSLYGAWTFVPVLSKRELARVSGIRVLLRVDHKVGTMHDDSADLTGQIQVSGSSGSDSIGATQLLTGGARGDAVDGRCGAIPQHCSFAMIQGSSAEGCNAGYSVQTRKEENVQNNSVWLGVVIGLSFALTATIALAIWTAWRIVVHRREVIDQRRYFQESERASV